MVKERRNSFSKVIFLLVVEFIALVSFSLGGTSPIFHYISIALLGLMFIFIPFDLKKEERFYFFITLGVILVLSGSIAFGNLTKDSNIISKIAFFLVIPSFFVIGVYARWIKVFELDYVLYAIGGGLALLVLISTIYTWSQYGLFHSYIYKSTPSYYYNGELFDVTKEMGWLSGFSFKTIFINYGVTYSMMLSCYLAMLLFISPKKDTRKFIIVSVLGSIGLISLITIPHLDAICMLIPVCVFAGYHRFINTNILGDKAKKIVRKILSLSYTILAIGLLLFFVADIVVIAILEPQYAVLENNELLRKIFYNGRIMQPINTLIAATMNNKFLFGIYPDKFNSLSLQLIATESRFFVTEAIKEGGIISLFAIVLLTVLTIRISSYYVKKSNDEIYQKVGLLAVLLGFFIFHLRYAITIPFVHEDTIYSLFRSSPFMIVIFIIGLVSVPRIVEKKNKKAVVSNDNTSNIIDDYNFTLDEEDAKNE